MRLVILLNPWHLKTQQYVKMYNLKNQVCQHSYHSITKFVHIKVNPCHLYQIYDLIFLLSGQILRYVKQFYLSYILNINLFIYILGDIGQCQVDLNSKILIKRFYLVMIYDLYYNQLYRNNQLCVYLLECMPNRMVFCFEFIVFIYLL